MRFDGNWTLVDLREAGAPTVLYRGGSLRSRTSLSRALSDTTSARRARAITDTIANWAIEARGGKPAVLEVDGLRCHPVPAPTGQLHAAWVTLDTNHSPPPTAASFEWDVKARVFRVPKESGTLVGRPDLVPRESGIISPEAFRFVEVDDSLGLVQALLTRGSRSWTGTATVRCPDGPVAAQVDVLPVAVSGEVVGLVFEIDGQPSTATAEAVAMSHLSDIHLLIMDVARMRVLRWLTDPPPGVAWKGRRDDRDAPHPEDVERIFHFATDIFTGKKRDGSLDGIRLRRLDGGWLVVDAAAELIDGSDPQLLIIQMTQRGTSDELDPVPAD